MSKFSKGDKVRRIKSGWDDMPVGSVWKVLKCEGEDLILEGTEEETEWLVEFYELVKEETKSYRNMKPTDLVNISIDGNESEVPLGDLVHATALLGVTNGWYGARFWEALNKSLGKDGFTEDMETVIEFRDKQKETEQLLEKLSHM